MTVDLSRYLVTDATQCAAAGRDVATTVAAAVAGGITAVQIREKHAEAGSFLDTVLAVARCLPDSVALFVNDRVDVYLAARDRGAAVTGVHVGQTDLPVSVVRRIVGDTAVIGLSAATPTELTPEATAGADYLGIGVLRPTDSKPDAPPPLGVAGFARLAALGRLPAVAIGGVTAADLPALRAAGAAGGAVVSAVCTATDPRSAAAELTAAWQEADQ